MGLKTRFRNLRNILAEDKSQTNEMLVLESPVLTTGMYQRFSKMVGEKLRVIDCSFEISRGEDPDGTALGNTLRRIKAEAEAAVKDGIENIVLTDEFVSDRRAAAPIILCVGAVQTHLVNAGLRSSCSIIVRSAECLDTHYFAVLIGAGATVVNAYMAQDSLSHRVSRGLLEMSTDEAVAQYKKAIEAGLLKIISKNGISVISSYRGGNNFEALGLSRALVGANFPGMTSRISGIGLAGLEAKILEAHEAAYDSAAVRLPVGGLYRVRAKGERHAYQADMIHMLQEADIAMNRIGAKSVSGEGGEDRARYKPLPNGDNPNSAVKQIASSPPPHHDIYSIEDLAQLIYDLKQINPTARVAVKLVASSGVGTIAAGVAKAKADTILIAGHNGGTGASPNTSLKYAGIPWELGLSEAHQVLTLNNLRGAVTLRTDGGLKTGKDIVIAAMLGAEEYGIGTLSLVAMGCIMVRQCHSNTCPVGVCVQDERLREKFTGTPEKVINLMTYIAEDVREILASLGAESLDDIIGRTDLLAQVSRGAENLDDLDLNPILAKVDNARVEDTRHQRIEVPETLDTQIIADAGRFFSQGEKLHLTYSVENTHRAVGTRTSSHIYKTFGAQGVQDGQLTVHLRGSAGQSLGAFGMHGLRIIVDGDANDYVGKGLSGAQIIIKPQGRTPINAHESAIIGNTCLYGATKGSLMAAGRAGERFAVRNSGAVSVVEGLGTNGCEYMTGGIVVVLGSVGDNFGAGMTGGMAYIYDENDQFDKAANPDNIVWQRLSSEHYEEELKDLIRRQAAQTGSEFAKTILGEWEHERGKFWQVVPKEMLTRLTVPLQDAAE